MTPDVSVRYVSTEYCAKKTNNNKKKNVLHPCILLLKRAFPTSQCAADALHPPVLAAFVP